MDESTNKGGLESKGSDAEIPKRRSFGVRPGGYRSRMYKVPELNDSYAGSSIIKRMVVKGYDTSPPTHRVDVEEALRKHFASRGIKLIHAYVPVDYETLTLCSYGFIYVYEEYEAEALKLGGSDMGGGRILEIKSYPFEDNHLDHVFPPTNPSDDIQQRTLKITGVDTSLDKDDIEKMLLEFIPDPESGIITVSNGSVLLAISGLDTMDKALKLSGTSVRGSKIAVTKVLPEKLVRCGLSSAARFALGKKEA
ncbi:uncharacterized protein LOC108861954 [Raphanus sativus]|uniref:Uncharacterized protein LOC108861954 n=1 Tax=Raphanus sativus TaxID=3726 RepID=A0A6J0P4G6_RAPSA|nr:uncharacterized protein LOC108861954 [Raphanus sativus]